MRGVLVDEQQSLAVAAQDERAVELREHREPAARGSGFVERAGEQRDPRSRDPGVREAAAAWSARGLLRESLPCVLAQGRVDRAPRGVEDLRRITQPHVGFGRVHVRVNVIGRQVEEEHTVRMPSDHREGAVAAGPRPGNRRAAHQPSVDEEQLHLSVGAIVSRSANEAAQLAVEHPRRIGAQR